ncbi:MAG: Cell division protein FtsI/penicillin-binding protein 2 [Oscillospiraceae bacterium]|jgi:penicillin-binding protein 2|nr:Cell division protein FtsI/penicillin-binding protein 2 [Oscillospiraceae bacterium]
MWKRLGALAALFGIAFSAMYMRIYLLTGEEDYKLAGNAQSSFILNVSNTYGNIYDCRMRLLNNNTWKILAVLNPTAENVTNILPFVKNPDAFYAGLKKGVPFVCEVTSEEIPNENILTFKVPIRTSESQLAPHIIGYTSDGKGVAGIEKAFNDFLRSHQSKISVKYEIDGLGNTLNGLNASINMDEEMKAGVVTTIDAEIQKICEKAAQKMKKGAIVVMDPSNGQLRAIVSVPAFSPLNVSKSLDDPDSPLINRALMPYNVGSVFKLVTAAAALEQGISPDLTYECTGKIDVFGQIFKCHKASGHGVLDMQGAIVNSCNTYFINLSEKLSSENFIAKASSFGFGRSTVLANGIVSEKGTLQSVEDLKNPAEKANMSFGQGVLTATPVQIAAMTSAIVNNGKLPKPQLIIGTTEDKQKVSFYENQTAFSEATTPLIALKLREFMAATVNENAESLGRPKNTTAGGKTSTAQTGRYDENGNEILEAWFTGYFPIDKPKYVVTVLVEGGKSGNTDAAPIFKEIAENITNLYG